MAYKAVIGLEFHCEMKSHTKVFSDAINGYSKKSNENVRPLDVGFPGTLPMVNKECVRKAIEAAMILNCKIPEYMEFDRKNYFYPDLPKGFQITQYFNPVGTNGKIVIDVNGKEKEVLIHDIHLEEDAASLDHYYDTSTIDYNRAGVPLLELVTEPCLHSADEAIEFLEHIKRIYEYTDISECDTKKGQIRADVNVSIMDEDSKELGTKVSSNDYVEVEGKALTTKIKKYYLLYKPREVISSASDDKGRKTVVDLIETTARIYPVGRLDYDTTGAILLTNDGEFANIMMHPKSNVDKVYLAKLEGIIKGEQINKLKDGIELDHIKVIPSRVKLKKVNEETNTCIVEITIHEGKNHQVKRMFEAVGFHVEKLKRVRMGIFTVENLKSGEYRKLTPKEVSIIYSLKK